MSLSRQALERALFQNGTGLENVPGLRSEVVVGQVITYLTEWDMTQFFGRLHEAIGKWEKENGRGFPIDFAFLDIHPNALRTYAKVWPPDQIIYDFGPTTSVIGSVPRRVYGIEIRENNRLHRTSWSLELAGRSLINGECLEVV